MYPSRQINLQPSISNLKSLYGFEGAVSPLSSYSDQNFLVEREDGQSFVLKIANADTPEAEIDMQVQVLRFLQKRAPELNVPRVIETLSGDLYTRWPASSDDASHIVWMVNFLPGQFISDFQDHPPELPFSVGQFLGQLDQVLTSFEHPAMDRKLQWDLKQAASLNAYLPFIPSPEKRKWIEAGLERFERNIIPRAHELRTSVIHNDANDNNVLTDGCTVMGIIDFGDMVRTFTVSEVAIAATYMMLGKPDPLAMAHQVFEGFNETNPLSSVEAEVYFDLIYLRLCTSVCMSAKHREENPENEYLAVSEAPAWELIERLIR